MARGDNLRSYYHRFCVEDCLILTLGQIKSIRSKEFREFILSKSVGQFSVNILEFYRTGQLKGRVFSIIRKEVNGLKLILSYSHNKEFIEERIHLSYQTLHFGGLKYYIHCPSCGRKCSKLYLIPKRQRFWCRYCGDLTYQSCKESEHISNFHHTIASISNCSLYEAKHFTNYLLRSRRQDMLTYIIEKPYIREEQMHATTLKLGTRQMKELNELSKKKDIPRSELIRRSIDLYLAKEIERELKAKQLTKDAE